MRFAVIVNGPPGSGKSTLAPPLAAALGLPLLSKDAVKETLLDNLGFSDRTQSRSIGAASGEVLWTILSSCPQGAVVESWLAPHMRSIVADGLRRAGVDKHVEVWCQCPADEALRRYRNRDRHPGHFDAEQLRNLPDVLATAEPLALGPVISVVTDKPWDVDEIASQVVARWAR